MELGMFNHIDPNNVPLSSSFYPSEQVHQNIEKKPLANRAITYLSEGSNISPELRNQKNKLVTIKLETSFQIDLPPISKAISQIKSEIPPQKQSLIIDPESSSQEIDQTEEEDIFSEEIDENIYNIRNESKSKALGEQTIGLKEEAESNKRQIIGLKEEAESNERQIIRVTEQTTSNLIAEEKIFEAAEDISKTLEDTSNSTNKASHKEQELISSKGVGDGNVKIEKQPQEQSILFSQDHAKMNKTIEKIKMQSIHLRNLGNLSEVNRETSSSRIEGNGLQIQARMKEVNGVLDSVTTNTEYPVSFEKLFLSVVDDEQNQRKFHNILQAGCDGCKTFVHRKKYDVLENIVKKVAEKHLKQAVIDNGSVDLAEEELKDFAKRLFYEAIEEGAVIGPNGQPVKLSSEEIEAWQKEFAEFFISYLISKNLLKNQKQSREESKSITVNISLLSTTYKRESEIEDQLYFLTLLDRSGRSVDE